MEQYKAAFWSFARVFAAAALAVFMAQNKSVWDVRVEDLEAMWRAGEAALLLTAFNSLRAGETRFGVGAHAKDDLAGG